VVLLKDGILFPWLGCAFWLPFHETIFPFLKVNLVSFCRADKAKQAKYEGNHKVIICIQFYPRNL